MRKEIILLFILLIVPFAIAQDIDTQEILDNLDELKENYNTQKPESSILDSLVGNEQIGITLEDGSEITVNLEKGEITDVQEGSKEGNTIELELTDKEIEDIYNGGSIIQKAPDIEIEGVGFWSKTKIWFVKLFINIAGIFK
jgi:hypothetical protein